MIPNYRTVKLRSRPKSGQNRGSPIPVISSRFSWISMHQPFLDVSWEQNEKGSHPFGPLHPLDPRVEMARGNNTTTGRKALVTGPAAIPLFYFF